jgi:ribosome recycling factor
MDRIKLPGVSEEARAAVMKAVEDEAHDEAVRLSNKRGMLTALIKKGVMRKPTVQPHVKAKRRARGKAAKASRKANR